MKLTALAGRVLVCFALATGPAHAADKAITALADRLAIEDLMVGYATAHDTTEPELYRKLFTDDAEYLSAEGKVTIKGIDAIIKSVITDKKRFNANAKVGVVTYGNMRHIITNMMVSVAGDTATGGCYLLTTAYNPNSKQPEILSIGRYEDRYVKRNGEWRIAQRRIISDWGNDEVAKQLGVGPYTPAEYRNQ
jgi:hypothetical protein